YVGNPADWSPTRNQATASPQLVNHTFGRQNDPKPSANRYDWLVHLDREPISVLELLHVSAYPPHLLTQRFMRSDKFPPVVADRFAHYAPWFDDPRRLYRLFEFLKVGDRALGGSPSSGRITGRINLNTVWDRETFHALCDANASNWIADDSPRGVIDQIFDQMVALRPPRGVPGPTNMDPAQLPPDYPLRGQMDKPFLSLATGYTQGAPRTQYLQDRGVNDTILRSGSGTGDLTAWRLFQNPADFD